MQTFKLHKASSTTEKLKITISQRNTNNNDPDWPNSKNTKKLFDNNSHNNLLQKTKQ